MKELINSLRIRRFLLDQIACLEQRQKYEDRPKQQWEILKQLDVRRERLKDDPPLSLRRLFDALKSDLRSWIQKDEESLYV